MDSADNCPTTFNPDQTDTDNDGAGDACDDDDDGDTILDADDNCPLTANTDQADCDGDGTGDACDPESPCSTDTDNDGIMDSADNCMYNENTDQADADGDGIGDVCDICYGSDNIDADDDGVCDSVDVPVANNDTYTISETTTLDVNVTIADVMGTAGDDLGTIPSIVVHNGLGGVTHGELTWNTANDGSFTYVPDTLSGGFVTDTFMYTITDANNNESTATVTINVTDVDAFPQANPDTFVATEDTLFNGNVVYNGTGPDSLGDTPAQIVLVDDAGIQNGTLTWGADDGTFTYLPNADFNTESNPAETFTYKIIDQDSDESATVTDTIYISAVNDLPNAVDDTFPMNEDGDPLSNDVRTNDFLQDTPVTISLVNPTTPVSKGSLAWHGDGTFTYTPNTDANGQDSFDYRLTDKHNETDVATVYINITPVNDAPDAKNDIFTGILEGSTANELDVLADHGNGADSDIDNDDLTISAVGDASHCSVAISGDNKKVLYTPDDDYFGTDSFSYTITDGILTDTATVNVTVDNINDAPVATADSYEVYEDETLNVGAPGVLTNDSDVDEDTLSAVLAAGPSYDGLFQLNPNGSFVYIPTENYNGPDSFTYHVVDDGNPSRSSEIVTVTLTVNAVNDDPVANGDTFEVIEDSDATILDVLANDTDADLGDTKTIISFTAPDNNGQVEIINNGSELSYTPAAHFAGTDIFTYTMEDAAGAESSAFVTVTVTNENDAPVAYDDAFPVIEDSGVTILDVLANDTDDDIPAPGDTKTIISFTAPDNGGAVINNGTDLSYVPAGDFNGTETFTYTMVDTAGVESFATVTVTVANLNDGPEAIDDNFTVAEDSGATILDVLANDTDADIPVPGDIQEIVGWTAPANGSVSINSNGKDLDYTPNLNFTGTDTFDYTMGDSAGLWSTATVTVIVTNTNDAPVANDDAAVVDEDGSVVINVVGNDTDSDGNLDPGTVAITPVANGSTSIDGSGNVTYTPKPNFNGQDSFKYTVSDSAVPSLTSNEATVTITVNPVNDVPNAWDDAITATEDVALDVYVLNNDELGDEPTQILWAIAGTDNGTVEVKDNGTPADSSDDYVTYTPAPGFNGDDYFTYRIEDADGEKDSATVDVVVGGDNDIPVANADTDTTPEDTAVTTNVLANDTPGDLPVTVEVTLAPTSGTAVVNGDNTITYTPAGNTFGSYFYEYTLSDAVGTETSTATVTIEVSSVEDTPVANGVTVSTDEDIAIVIDVLANATDGDVGDVLSITNVSTPANGTAVVNDNGTPAPSDDVIDYMPALDFNGQDSFTFTVTDSTDRESQPATININVLPVDDTPVANNDIAGTYENQPVDINVLTNDTDGDGDVLTITNVSTPANGTAVVNNNGTSADPSDDFIDYIPALNFNGQDSFTYQVIDTTSRISNTAMVSVTVNALSFAPYFTSTPYEDALIDQMYRYRITAVDDNGDPVTIYGENLPDWLTLTDVGDGRAYLAGTPTIDEVGNHDIELVASDGVLTGTQTFTLRVHNNDIEPNDKTNWLATCSYEETVHRDQRCMYAIDGDPVTYWQSEWTYYNPDAILPHWIEIDLGNVYDINGIIYTPRQNKLTSHINEYELYVSIDGTLGAPVASGQFVDGSYAPQEVTFPTETVRYIRLVSLSNFPGDTQEQTAIGELDIIISEVDVQQEPNEAPDGFIDIPFGVSNVNINVGETVSFAGHGSDPDGDLILYHWDFGSSGNPVFTGPVPGEVQFDIQGAHVVTFTVYDGLMAYDLTPVTLTVNVAGSGGGDNMPRDAWSVIYVSSQELDSVYRPAENSFDTYLSTYWQSNWQVNYPHEIQIDLGDEYQVDGFRYLPRPDKSNGRIEYFEFYVRSLGQPWGDPVITGTFVQGSAEQEIWFPAEVTGQQIRLVALNDFNGTETACVADLNIFGAISGNQRPDGTIDSPVSPVAPINIGETLDFTGSGIDLEDGTENLSYQWDFGNPNNWDFVNPASSTTDEDPGLVQFDAPGSYVVTLTVTDSEGLADSSPASITFEVVSEDSILINQSEMSVEYVESERADFGRGAVKVLDGNPATFWRTDLFEHDPNAALPNEIHIDLGNFYELDTIRYLPRQDNQNGRINEFELYVSWDYDGEWGDLVATGNWLNSTAEQNVSFPRTLCRYVRLVANTGWGDDITSMAEFNAMGKLYAGLMPNQPPNGVIVLPVEDPKVINIGHFVEFSGTGSDPDGDTITYQWDFGDPDVNAAYANEATQAYPGLVQFDNPGTYFVSLTVADAEDVDPSPATRQIQVKYNSIDLPKYDWTVSCISEETQYADQGCDNIIDGNPASYWNTQWGVVTNYPHWVILDLDGMYNIDEIIYTPRPNKSAGRIKDYELYISDNNIDWNLVKSGTLLDTYAVQSILISRTTGNFVKIVINSVHDVGTGYSSSIAEIDIRGDYIQSSMVIDPEAISVLSGDTVNFTASGGVGPYIFSLLDNQSDGEITAGGVYTAGTNVNGGVIDTVRVFDEGTWAVKDAVVTVAGPLAITPSFRYVAVNGRVDFSATGGIPPYEFTFDDSASGGTLNTNTGEYQAGATHSVTDYIRVTDMDGNFSNASVEILDLALSITPTMPDVATGVSQQFYATGGIPPYVFQDVYMPSGGGITPDGLYTAGGNIGVTDIIQVADQGGAGTSVQTDIYVTELYTTLDQSQWTVHYVDSEELDNESTKPAENAFDGDIDTSWQSQWLLSSPPPPHELQIDLGGNFLINGFRYYPHQKNSVGWVDIYEFYVSTDGSNWGDPVSIGFFPYNADTEQQVIFQTKIARYVRFVGVRAINNNPVISVAELNIMGQLYDGIYLPPDSIIELPSDNLTINAGESIVFSGYGLAGDGPSPLTYHWNFGDAGIDDQYSASPGSLAFETPGTFTITFTVSDGAGTADPSPDTRIIKVLGLPGAIIPQGKWELVAVDSEQIDNGVYRPAVHAFDGVSSTFWRTELIDFHPDAPDYPHDMIINLGSSYLLDTLRYLPRQYITGGRIADYYVFVSEDGRDWGTTVASGTFENNNTEQYAMFFPKRGQFIRFVGINEVNGQEMATVAELNLEGTCDVPYVKIIDPQDDIFVHQKNLTVTASVCLNSTYHTNWGVRFIVDDVTVEEVSLPTDGVIFPDTFKVTIEDIGTGYHDIEVFIIDASGRDMNHPDSDVPDENTYDVVSNFLAGEYYVAMGNSITFGLFDDFQGDDVSVDGRNSGGGFEPVLNNLLTDELLGTPHTVVNSGVSGETTLEGLRRLPNVLSVNPYSGYFLLLYGANDRLSTLSSGLGTDPEADGYPHNYKSYLQQMINMITSAVKEVYIAKNLHRNNMQNLDAEEYNKVIDELVVENSILITPPPFFEYFKHHPEQQVDSIHPDGIGYRAMAKLWRNALMGYNNDPVAVDNLSEIVLLNSEYNEFDVLFNDYDYDLDTLTITDVSYPVNGIATVDYVNNVIVYTPDSDYTGSDSFYYTISDGQDGEATATVEIFVNTPPTAEDDIFSTIEQDSVDNILTILSNDDDDNGDPLTITAVSETVNGGTVTIDDDVILYTPLPGYTSSDSFTYDISDGIGGTDTGTVTITVI